MKLPRPAHDLPLEPLEDRGSGGPVVSDVDGRLWRVRVQLSSKTADLLVAAVVLLLCAAIGAALLL